MTIHRNGRYEQVLVPLVMEEGATIEGPDGKLYQAPVAARPDLSGLETAPAVGVSASPDGPFEPVPPTPTDPAEETAN